MRTHTHVHKNSPTITPPSLLYFLFPSCFSMLSLSLEKLVTCGVIRSYNFVWEALQQCSVWHQNHTFQRPRTWEKESRLNLDLYTPKHFTTIQPTNMKRDPPTPLQKMIYFEQTTLSGRSLTNKPDYDYIAAWPLGIQFASPGYQVVGDESDRVVKDLCAEGWNWLRSPLSSMDEFLTLQIGMARDETGMNVNVSYLPICGMGMVNRGLHIIGSCCRT